jgi:hypothetical protein
LTYLRFTHEENSALCLACGDRDLPDDFFPVFRYFLAETLYARWPALAARVARLRQPHLRLLYDHLKVRNRPAAQARAGRGRHGLSFEDFRTVARAALYFALGGGRRAAFRGFLLHFFRQEEPALADRLARLTGPEVTALYRRARRPAWWRA